MIAILLPEAEREAEDAADYYDAQQPGLGLRFTAAVRATLGLIEAMPRMYGRTSPAVKGREIRVAPVSNRFSYTVVYEVLPTQLLVVAVAHTSRRPNYWRGRLR